VLIKPSPVIVPVLLIVQFLTLRFLEYEDTPWAFELIIVVFITAQL